VNWTATRPETELWSPGEMIATCGAVVSSPDCAVAGLLNDSMVDAINAIMHKLTFILFIFTVPFID
jgi:hypothetical protein